MLPWIIQMSVISLILIVLVHYLFTFFKTNLTIPKVKDLVTLPQKKYNEMFDSLQHPQPQLQRATNDNDVNISTQSMKEDLIHFLKDLGSNSNSSSEGPPSYSFDSNISSFSFTK